MVFNRNKGRPPRFGEWILRGMSEYLPFGALGDLEEEYRRTERSNGKLSARIWYWTQIFTAVPSYFKLCVYWRMHMFQSYLKISLRIIKKHKAYSFINIFGLALGMACCIVILLWVQDEVSYDRFHKNINSLYRVVCQNTVNNDFYEFAVTPAPIGAVLKSDFPEIEKSTMYGGLGAPTVKHGDKVFSESRYGFVDPDFFEIFSFDLVKGDKSSLFSNLYSVVITEEIAEKYFDTEDPIGKTLTINNRYDVIVTGVIKNVPRNSTIRFNFLSPFELLMKNHYGTGASEDWDRFSHSTFVTLSKDASLEVINQKIRDLKKNIDPESSITFYLQPIDRMHLYSAEISSSFSGRGDIKYIYILSSLALLILFIACINFMNLMTARSGSRAREVGMRKVVGAHKSDIVRQFFSETVLLSFFAFFVSLVIVYFVLPEFNSLSGKELIMSDAKNLNIILGLAGIVFLTGIFSGSYPAFFISAFQPVKILKGNSGAGSKGRKFRTFLVVSQFSLSIILIIGAIVLSKQLDFIRTKNLGYNRENIISIRLPDSANHLIGVTKTELLQLPEVISVTASRSGIAWRETRIRGLVWEGQIDENNEVGFNVDYVDTDYIKTLEIEMAYGRNFSDEFSTDTTAFILNEEAIRQMGLASPIGKSFTLHREGQIVGVVKDFIFDSFDNPIEPLVMAYRPSRFHYIHIKIKPDNIEETLTTIENHWKRIIPDYPFNYEFAEEDFNWFSRTEQKISTIFRYSAFLGIFISCLGLIGLASYIAQQRTKEIGIRKVLGASVTGITTMMLREFVKWTVLANIIAWPVGWFAGNIYLENYIYRTEFGWTIFIISGLTALGTALITVSFQAVKAARANPVDSLKFE